MERLLVWYSGAQVERGWTARAQARRALLSVLEEPDVRAQIPSIRRGVRAYIADDEADKTALLDELDKVEDAPSIKVAERARLQAIRRAADGSSDRTQRNVRSFRNLLLVTSLALTFILSAIAILHGIDPDLFSVCASEVPPGGGARCPGGSSSPRGTDVLEIEMVGALGGLLAALLPLARLQRLEGPYSLPAAQLVLKVPSGAATAFLGILLLQSGVLGDLVPQAGDHIVAWAAFFGFAQQALTRRVDEHARLFGTLDARERASASP